MKTEKVVRGNVTYWVDYEQSVVARGGNHMVVAVGKLFIKRDDGSILQGETEWYQAFGRTPQQATEGACKRVLKRLERIAGFISGDDAPVAQSGQSAEL